MMLMSLFGFLNTGIRIKGYGVMVDPMDVRHVILDGSWHFDLDVTFDGCSILSFYVQG